MTREINRRSFLKLTGLAGVVTAGGHLIRWDATPPIPRSTQPEFFLRSFLVRNKSSVDVATVSLVRETEDVIYMVQVPPRGFFIWSPMPGCEPVGRFRLRWSPTSDVDITAYITEHRAGEKISNSVLHHKDLIALEKGDET